MNANQANEVYAELLKKVCYNSKDIIHTWQKNRGVDIPQLIRELGDKRRKASFRLLMVLSAYIIVCLGIEISLISLPTHLFYKSYPHLFMFFVLASQFGLLFLVLLAKEKWFLGPENDARNVSQKVYDTLSDLERDLSLFGKGSIDSETSVIIDENTFTSSTLSTALSLVEAQNKLLRLTSNGSALTNAEEVAKTGKEIIELRRGLDDKISSASRFGIVLNRNNILSKAQRIS